MHYPTPEYTIIGDPCELELRSFDGTTRRITFVDVEKASAALRPGRAEIDSAAIKRGFLPRGADAVSAARMPSADELRRWTIPSPGGMLDPLALIRAQFSLRLLIDRSAPIDRLSDARARTEHWKDALRYDEIADDLDSGGR
jgi:hypothetical protein